MTRSELIQRLSERHPQLLHKDAEVSVATILGAMHDALRAAWQLLLNEGAAQEKILMETSICILQNMDEA